MTKDETVKIIFILRANYPEAYAKMTTHDLEYLALSWTKMLEGYSFAEVESAVEHYIVTDTFGKAPKVGQIIDSLAKLKDKDELNANAAWALVYKAICNSNYNAEEEFNKLPVTCQKAVGHYHNLIDYAQMKVEDVQVTVKAHFKSVYEVEVKREKERSKLPPSIKERLENKNTMRLEG